MNRRDLMRYGLGTLAASALPGGLLLPRTSLAYDQKQYNKVVNGAVRLGSPTRRAAPAVGPATKVPTHRDDRARRHGLICQGSTTMQGKYSKNLQNCVNYIVGKCRSNGLIGDPKSDDRYTYGHGYSMMFSQPDPW